MVDTSSHFCRGLSLHRWHSAAGVAARAKALEILQSVDLDEDGTLSEAEWSTFITSVYSTRCERDAL